MFQRIKNSFSLFLKDIALFSWCRQVRTIVPSGLKSHVYVDLQTELYFFFWIQNLGNQIRMIEYDNDR